MKRPPVGSIRQGVFVECECVECGCVEGDEGKCGGQLASWSQRAESGRLYGGVNAADAADASGYGWMRRLASNVRAAGSSEKRTTSGQRVNDERDLADSGEKRTTSGQRAISRRQAGQRAISRRRAGLVISRLDWQSAGWAGNQQAGLAISRLCWRLASGRRRVLERSGQRANDGRALAGSSGL